MFRLQSSIRKKITISYVLNFLFVTIIGAVIFMNLLNIEGRIGLHESKMKFFEAVLEIRRYEKNYFLYRKKADYEEALSYLDSIEKLIKKDEGKFDSTPFLSWSFDWTLSGFKSAQSPGNTEEFSSARILKLISEYRDMLKTDFAIKTHSPALDKKIREKGREITVLAETSSQREHENINNILVNTRTSLIIFGIIFLFGSSLIAQFISKIAILPLKRLEKRMQRISSGKFELLSIESGDKEISAMNDAFNRMIKELFSQRDIIRSEKLTSLGIMLAGIAHEVNNPLSNISTSVEILAEEINSENNEFKKSLIEQIVHETDRASEIVRAVLEFTRDREFKKETLKLLTLVNDTMLFIKSDVPPHVDIEINIPEVLTIYADKQKFQHVILNLVMNAVDALSDRGREGKIIINAREVTEREVEIKIADTGKGIPEEIIERIFDPFFTTKEVGRGTGLGLFVTHSIIEQHGGKISVSSTSGEGTTFTINLPSQESAK